ncbi:MAG: hypothetical protein DRQ88_04395 [Epsilonproteobacteria bacterium]|nr:MAG: hypothetical protein DRQ89_10045 [Campylobacterota bacterium]RLA66998.1 MAG: hypothetical protein DRQ88_04395 [Campylobacterota bacterium]
MKILILLFFFFFNPVYSQEQTNEDFIKFVLAEVQKEWVIYVQDYAEKKNVRSDVFAKKLPRKLERTIKNIPIKSLRTYAVEDPLRRKQLRQLFKGYLDTQYAVETGEAPGFYGDDPAPTLVEKKGRSLRQIPSQVSKTAMGQEQVPWWKKYLLYIIMGIVFLLMIVWDKVRKKDS